MLTPLHDLHVWLVDPRGQAVPTFRPSVRTNFERGRWESAMRDASYLAHHRDFGEGTVGGYAYLYIGSWKEPINQDALDLALARMRDAPGLIIDVRNNAGGTDQTALAFVSRFTTRAFTASYVEIRMDSLVRNIEMPLARTIGPRGGWQFTRPVVVLSGRGGFSATESFVAAMRTLPQVTVVGDTTGGASGNPATFALGNGWRFTVPRWLEFGPDKRPIEGRGVAPHLAMTWDLANYDSARDPLIDAAVGLLGERNGVYRIAPGASHEARVER
jgi:C-terminal processing protease CtpA/Prc